MMRTRQTDVLLKGNVAYFTEYGVSAEGKDAEDALEKIMEAVYAHWMEPTFFSGADKAVRKAFKKAERTEDVPYNKLQKVAFLLTQSGVAPIKLTIGEIRIHHELEKD